MKNWMKRGVALALVALMLLALVPATMAAESVIWATEEGKSIKGAGVVTHTGNSPGQMGTDLITPDLHYCSTCQGVYTTSKHNYADGAAHDAEAGKTAWGGAGYSFFVAMKFNNSVNLTSNWKNMYLEFDWFIPEYDATTVGTKKYTALKDLALNVELSSSGTSDQLEVYGNNLKFNDYVVGGLKQNAWNTVKIPLSKISNDFPGGNAKFQTDEYGILGSDGKYHFDYSKCNFLRICSTANIAMPGNLSMDLKNFRFTGELAGCANGHTHGDSWMKDGDVHYHICTVCGNKVDEARHVYDDDNDVTCNVCGHEKGQIDFSKILLISQWGKSIVNETEASGIKVNDKGNFHAGTTPYIHICTVCNDVFYDDQHVFPAGTAHDAKVGEVAWDGSGASLKYGFAFDSIALPSNWRELYLELDLFIPVITTKSSGTKKYTDIGKLNIGLELSSSGRSDVLEVSGWGLLESYVADGIVEGAWNHLMIPMSRLTGKTPGNWTGDPAQGLAGSDGKLYFNPEYFNFIRFSCGGGMALPGGLQFDAKNFYVSGPGIVSNVCTDHVWGDELKSDERGHFSLCENCNTASSVTAHNWSGEYITNPAGHRDTCADCGYRSEIVAHKAGDWESQGSAIHSQNCEVCDYQITSGTHEWTNACDPDCNVCGYERNVNHAYADDCDTTCENCGEVRDVEHAYAEDLKYDADNHWKACENCDATTDVEPHAWDDGVVTTKPTTANKGVKTFTCACGATYTEDIAKLPTVTSSVADGWDGKSAVTFTPDADTTAFVSITVNGVALNAANYTVANGAVTLNPEYLETLVAGEYTIELAYENGSATTTLTVPENNMTMIIVVVAVAVVAIAAVVAAIVVVSKKKKA